MRRACLGMAFAAIRGNAASNIQMVANNCQRLGEVALYAEFGFQGALIANNIVDIAATGTTATSNLIRNARVGIGVTGDQNAGAVMITANMISGAKDGAIRALKLAEPCGADLALSKIENGRILIDRNLAI